MAEAIDDMVIDHADGLHQSVTDDGPDEFKSPSAHIRAQGQRFRARVGYLAHVFPVVLYGLTADKGPEIAVETAKCRLDFKKAIRIGDKGPDLEVVADNALVLQQFLDFGLVVAGHPARIESMECPAIG